MVKKMIKFGKGVVKCRFLILILAFLLLIPSAIGYMKTRINYDILSYLPGQIETMKGQDILLDEFGTGAFSFVVVEGMQDMEASSDKISPNIFSVRITSNCFGSFTSCIAQLSTSICSYVTSG